MPVQVFSFYIFDRHSHRVHLLQALDRPLHHHAPLSTSHTSSDHLLTSPPTSSSATLHPHRASAPAGSLPTSSSSTNNGISGGGAYRDSRSAATRAKDDAKLIFGTVFSLRNMVRKLGGDDDAFISYRTAQYKLHYYETPSSLRFAMLTEPGALSMRNVLHQIYINLWVEYGEFISVYLGREFLRERVCSIEDDKKKTRNGSDFRGPSPLSKTPLSPVEHKNGDGVRNEMFEMGLDKFVRGLM
ncbi:Transport protein particle subunit bet5 [Apiospora rasikravindrae]|uniref:Trafficking protein particle complex subunit n=1 Tax=Apiospora rasikravindrae TaxID=990691 RepID=A0ABR1T758_9PEZI